MTPGEEKNPEFRDTVQQKERLLAFLGPTHGPRYFDLLAGFLTAKRPRTELASFVKEHFPTSAQLHRHNDFVLNILHNAHLPDPDYKLLASVEGTQGTSKALGSVQASGTLPIDSSLVPGQTGLNGMMVVGGAGSKEAEALGAAHAKGLVVGKDGKLRPTGDSLRGTDVRRRMLKKQVLGLPKAERDRLKAMLRKKRVQRKVSQWPTAPTRPVESVLDRDEEFIPMWMTPDAVPGMFTPLAQDAGVLPATEALRTRLRAITSEHGLSRGVAPDVADFLSKALEAHLKTLLEHCSSKLTATSPGDTVEKDSVLVDERAFDLVAEMAPHAFVEPIPGLSRIGVSPLPTASTASTPSSQESQGARGGSAMVKLQMEEMLADILGA
ncbi:transcriptional regulator of RNA polII, SAGA, subunit-domain-containing protein [Piptocephalis cylindrospora]|uniref:Transcriptional regulator of RNA polII, SAGA, subunit-domain-containing protein n=1 Tax=Piptocephalis cylindrospora TaxID=1907219 RepID=A0A4V1IYC5_9FUNG|nr:transcriptional regulator of RNA polII, SAGA, subunit-domain-containing protein [Piptocephalis cylindrospora]|eukprot:RKP14079.1 transcriptional regulator of RNA polII, SAGA, subunit-domain-containing protein [Piptocephalis cylindrospora]